MEVMAEIEETLQELARRAGTGDRAAFEKLLEHFQGQLQTWIRLRLGDRLRATTDPGDIFQETLLRALRSAERFKWQGERSFANWLARIAENTIQEQVRRAAREGHSLLQDDPVGDDVSPSRSQRRRERFERLQDALDTLDPVSRQVVELSRLDGRSLKDIAALVDRSPNAVALVLMRAQQKLRRRLGDTESLGLPDQALSRGEAQCDDSGSV
jgi:RNA polymerase sigma-70 factor (ECF subfamily)